VRERERERESVTMARVLRALQVREVERVAERVHDSFIGFFGVCM
jgi:hypothetical protein